MSCSTSTTLTKSALSSASCSSTTFLAVRVFGSLVRYDDALRLQRSLLRARKRGDVPDCALVLQHANVVTVGKRAEVGKKHVKTSAERLAKLHSCEFVETDRGGDATFHGPGQVVCYPIVHLREKRLGAKAYVEQLERAMVDVAKGFGIVGAEGGRKDAGAWVGEKKLGAVGVRISGGVAMHGLAMNVETDLEFFREHVVPCGLEGKEVTSLKELLGGGEVSRERVEVELIDALARQLGYTEIFQKRVG